VRGEIYRSLVNAKGILLPARRSLYQECLRVMRARLQQGEWGDYLPGERVLAEQLQVGRDTIRLTLAELTAEGWIDAASGGKRRKILKRKSAKRAKASAQWRIGMLSPFQLERMSQMMLSEVDHVRSLIAQRGGCLELHVPSWYEGQSPQRRLEALIAEQRYDAWILHRSTAQVQQYFQESRTPCLLRGHPHVGVDLPHIDYDWRAIARHAMGELWRKGHRVIGILLPDDRLRGSMAALEGAHSFHEEGVTLREIWENGTTEGLLQSVQHVVTKANPPTAFIALRTRQVLSLVSWLGSCGHPVPKHFSLISLAEEPFFEFIVPKVSTYHIEPSSFARKVVRHLELLVDGQIGDHGSLLFMPEYVPGASVGKISC
jgi:DNA-binding LacI/PurR family transcriptional regulator